MREISKSIFPLCKTLIPIPAIGIIPFSGQRHGTIPIKNSNNPFSNFMSLHQAAIVTNQALWLLMTKWTCKRIKAY